VTVGAAYELLQKRGGEVLEKVAMKAGDNTVRRQVVSPVQLQKKKAPPPITNPHHTKKPPKGGGVIER